MPIPRPCEVTEGITGAVVGPFALRAHHANPVATTRSTRPTFPFGSAEGGRKASGHGAAWVSLVRRRENVFGHDDC